jgi:hypothetical protein
MTRDQQVAAAHLKSAEDQWLIAYYWRPAGRRWTHPRLPGREYCHQDALHLTRMDVTLGWPDRSLGCR